jgi:hypothetical protein
MMARRPKEQPEPTGEASSEFVEVPEDDSVFTWVPDPLAWLEEQGHLDGQDPNRYGVIGELLRIAMAEAVRRRIQLTGQPSPHWLGYGGTALHKIGPRYTELTDAVLRALRERANDG